MQSVFTFIIAAVMIIGVISFFGARILSELQEIKQLLEDKEKR